MVARMCGLTRRPRRPYEYHATYDGYVPPSWSNALVTDNWPSLNDLFGIEEDNWYDSTIVLNHEHIKALANNAVAGQHNAVLYGPIGYDQSGALTGAILWPAVVDIGSVVQQALP